MNFIGLRKDKETQEVVKYDLKLYKQDIACLYQDRYGVYICTNQGKMFMVEHSLQELKEEIN